MINSNYTVSYKKKDKSSINDVINRIPNRQREIAKQVRAEEERRKNAPWYEKLWHSAADFGGGLAAGVLGFGEGLVDTVVGLSGGIGGIFGADTTWAKDFVANDWTGDTLLKPLNDYTKSSWLDGKGKDIVQGVAQGIGQMLPGIVATAVTHGAAAPFVLPTLITSSAGSGMQQAFNDGAGYGEGLLYGGITGGLEGLMEKATGGVSRVAKVGGKAAVKGIGKTIVKEGLSEAFEEGAQAMLDPIAQTVYKGGSALQQYATPEMWQGVGMSALVGGLSGGAVQGVGHLGNIHQAGGKKQFIVRDYQMQKAEVDQKINELQAKGELTPELKQSLFEAKAELDRRIDKNLSELSFKKQEKFFNKPISAPLKSQFELGEDGIRRIIKNEDINIADYNSEAYSASIDLKNVEYLPTKAKVSAEQTEAISEFNRLNVKNDRKFVITDSLPKDVNGAYKNGVIYVSSKADALTEVVKHEFTHSLEGTKEYSNYARYVLQMLQGSPELAQKMAIFKDSANFTEDYAKVTMLYEKVNSVATLEQSENNVLSELVAMYTSESIFTDEKQINRLASKAGGMFRKVYTYIKQRIASYRSKKTLSASELRTYKFLQKAETLYKRAMGNGVINLGNGVSYDISKTFEEQVDEVLNGTFDKKNSHILVRDDTPDIYREKAGLKNLPMLISYNKLCISMFQSGVLSDHYHNLGESIIKQLPNALSEPLYIIKPKDKENRVEAVINLKDAKGRDVFSVIEFDSYGFANNRYTPANIIVTAYGVKKIYITNRKNNGIVLYDKNENTQPEIQKKNESSQVNPRGQFPSIINETSSSINSINQNDEKVNSFNVSEQENTKFSIKKDKFGRQYVNVDTNQEIFKGMDVKYYSKLAKMYILDYFKDKIYPLTDNDLSYITTLTANKLTHPGIKLSKKLFVTKMKATTELDNMLSASEFIGSEKDSKNHNFATLGFAYYKTRFVLDGKCFSAVLNIGLSDNGKMLYEINNIKEESDFLINAQQNVVDESSKSLSSINNINQNDEKVNSFNASDQKNTKFSINKDILFKENNQVAENGEVIISTKPQFATKSLQNKYNFAINILSKNINNDLCVQDGAKLNTKQEISELAEQYWRNGTIDPKLRDETFNSIYENGRVEINTVYDENTKMANEIKSAVLNIPYRLQKQYEDIQVLVRQAKGKVRVRYSDNSCVSIDSFYDSLMKDYPQWFKAIDGAYERLVKIIEVASDIQSKTVTLDEYNGKEFRDYAQIRYHEGLAELCDRIAKIKLVNKEKLQLTAKKSSVETTVSTVEELIKTHDEVKNLRKKYDKAYDKAVLSEDDKRDIEVYVLKPNKKASGIVKQLGELKRQINGLDNVLRKYKKEITSKRLAVANKALIGSELAKDKAIGFMYSRETAERNFIDVFGKEQGEKLIEIYYAPMVKAETERLKYIKEKTEKYRYNKHTRKERELVQMLVEGKAIAQGITEGVDVDKVLAWAKGENVKLSELEKSVAEKVKTNEIIVADIDGIKNYDSIKQTVAWLKADYQEFYDRINAVRVANGYPPIPFRKNYAPHFYKENDKVTKFFESIGLGDIFGKGLPTEIIGRTKDFRPGSKWCGNFLQRTGKETMYDYKQGLDLYLGAISKVIFHTDNIQNLRMLELAVRTKYSDDGIKAEINEILENPNLSEDDAQSQIDTLCIDTTRLSNFVVWLRKHTNQLAGKQADMDRIAEEELGRALKVGSKKLDIYKVFTVLKNRVAANMIGCNIGSALTNFIPITQAWAGTSTGSMIRAFWGAFKNIFVRDGFEEMSGFITRRKGVENLHKTKLQKVGDTLGWMFRFVDGFTSNVVVRAKYYDLIKQGIIPEKAMEQADRFAASVMVDRSYGAMPIIFAAKNPLMTAFTMFQPEANNQFSYFKDIKRSSETKTAFMWAIFKLLLGAWLFNELYEKIIGRRPAFDPIGMVIDSYGVIVNDNLTNTEKTFGIITEGVQELPFIGGLVGGGRLPINAALPDFVALSKGESTAQKEFGKMFWYALPPFAGGQIKKTVEGISTVVKGGVYKPSGELKYTVDDNFGNIVRGALFGRAALTESGEYYDSFKQSTKAKIDAFFADKEVRQIVMAVYSLTNEKSVIPPKLATYYSVDGEKVFYSAIEYRKLEKKYKGYAEQTIKSITTTKAYSEFTKDERAALFKRIYADAKDYAKGGKQYLFSCAIKDFNTISLDIRKIEADKDKNGETIPNSRKNNIYKYVDDLMINKYQKYLLMCYAGYKVPEKDRVGLKKHIIALPLSNTEKRQLILLCGLE